MKISNLFKLFVHRHDVCWLLEAYLMRLAPIEEIGGLTKEEKGQKL